MEFLLYITSGALVGLVIGLTGIGGGSLMTPLLLMFGIPPHVAVGTDLLYASITKASGVVSHHKQKSIRWEITWLLALGSIPAALITGFILYSYFNDFKQYTGVITTSLGVMLIITASMLIFRKKLQVFSQHQADLKQTSWLQKNKAALTVAMGVLLGVFVTLSSVGAGAIGTAILLVLYPHLRSINIIGTDLAHAVPLTMIGGLIHLSLGNVNFSLLGALLIGSIPAIHLGSKLGTKLPESVLRTVLASLLMGLGAKYVFF